MLDDWQAIHNDEPFDGIRMIHGCAEGYQRAPVMTHHREPVVAEVSHECRDIACHRPLGRLRMLGLVRRQRRLAIATEVRADDEE